MTSDAGGLTFNIVNPDAIPSYIKGFAQDDGVFDERLYDYLNITLSKPLKKSKDNMRLLETLPEDAPNWLSENWGKVAFYEFSPTPVLDSQIITIKNWLRRAIKNGAQWLEKTDKKGRPLKLLKMGSLKQIINEIAKSDYELTYQEQRQILMSNSYFADEELAGHIYTLIVFPNDWRIVALLTEEALDRESQEMGSCVGKGNHDWRLAINDFSKKNSLFSIRDSKNRPQATFMTGRYGNSIEECRGPKNKTISNKVFPYLHVFMDKTGSTLSTAWLDQLGLLQIGNQIYDINDLPEHFVYEGDFDLTGYSNFVFPKHMRITGDLKVDDKILPLIPGCLTVDGDVIELCNSFSFKNEQHTLETRRKTVEGITLERKWYRTIFLEEPKLHRENGPAHIIYNTSKESPHIKELWYKNGKKHRTDGPAVVVRDPNTRKILMEEFWYEDAQVDQNRNLVANVICHTDTDGTSRIITPMSFFVPPPASQDN